MDRRKALATTGAISLTATAAIVALGSSMGLFGLANDDNTRVGKLSPIDTKVTQPATDVRTVIVDDPAPVTPGAPATGNAGSGRSAEAREDGQHQSTDHGSTTPPAAINTAPTATDDHHAEEPGDDHGETHDDAGSGSTHIEHDDD